MHPLRDEGGAQDGPKEESGEEEREVGQEATFLRWVRMWGLILESPSDPDKESWGGLFKSIKETLIFRTSISLLYDSKVLQGMWNRINSREGVLP